MNKISEDNVRHKEKRKTNELTIIKTDIDHFKGILLPLKRVCICVL